MERKTINDGDLITYKGGSDVIRLGNGFHWRIFGGDGIELIIGKQYPVISSCCMQAVYIKKGDDYVKDVSGERYLYRNICNELGEQIYVWEGFFKENENL